MIEIDTKKKGPEDVFRYRPTVLRLPILSFVTFKHPWVLTLLYDLSGRKWFRRWTLVAEWLRSQEWTWCEGIERTKRKMSLDDGPTMETTSFSLVRWNPFENGDFIPVYFEDLQPWWRDTVIFCVCVSDNETYNYSSIKLWTLIQRY